MNSADAWHEDPADGEVDDLEALLGLSVELVDTMDDAKRKIDMEEAKERHPAGKALVATPAPGLPDGVVMESLNAADRCDQGCGAGALYRLRKAQQELDLCHHHKNRNWALMEPQGWSVAGINHSLMSELYDNDRLKGSDHA